MLSINRPLQDGCQNGLLNSLLPQVQTHATDPFQSGTKLNSVFQTPSTKQVLGQYSGYLPQQLKQVPQSYFQSVERSTGYLQSSCFKVVTTFLHCFYKEPQKVPKSITGAGQHLNTTHEVMRQFVTFFKKTSTETSYSPCGTINGALFPIICLMALRAIAAVLPTHLC